MLGVSGIDAVILHGIVLVIAVIAAATDVTRGIIPNWLTLPIIVGAPIVHGVIDGAGGLLRSVMGLLVCALVPLLIWYGKGMAAGDVKVFAAIGAVSGLEVGLGAQFMSLIVAAAYAVGQLAWNGRLLRSLGNSVFIAVNPVLPRRHRRKVPREMLHRIRLGAPILLGSLIALAGQHRALWPADLWVSGS